MIFLLLFVSLGHMYISSAETMPVHTRSSCSIIFVEIIKQETVLILDIRKAQRKKGKTKMSISKRKRVYQNNISTRV